MQGALPHRASPCGGDGQGWQDGGGASRRKVLWHPREGAAAHHGKEEGGVRAGGQASHSAVQVG